MRKLALISVLLLGALGCGEDDECEPGTNVGCLCDDGSFAVQMCTADGLLGVCTCGMPQPEPDAGSDASVDAMTDAGVDASSDASMDSTPDALPDVMPDVSEDTMEDTAPDAPTEPDEGPMEGSLNFVIGSLTVSSASDVPVVGFDLDGTGDAVCGQSDFLGDVDNQLARLKPTIDSLVGDLNGQIRGSIFDGSTLILLEVIGAEDEGDVEVVVRLGLPLMSAPPMVLGLSLAAGQMFDIDASFTPVTVAGSISEGRLTIPEVSVIAVDIGLASVDVEDVRLEGTRGPADVTLDNGILGGKLDVEALVEAVAPGLPPGITPDVVMSLLGGSADLDDDGSGCKSISTGFAFTAVSYVPGEVR